MVESGSEPPSRIRLSDAEREAAAQRLHVAASEGRLTLAEVDERLAAVYRSATAADLEPLFADLPPAPAIPGTPAGIVPAADGLTRLTRPAGLPDEPVILQATVGSIKRDGDWIVPAWLEVRLGSGSIVLNCVQARFASAVTAIDITLGSGSIKVLVGPGVTADLDRVTVGSGSARSRVPAAPIAGRPHMILAGTVKSGSLAVRRPFFGPGSPRSDPSG